MSSIVRRLAISNKNIFGKRLNSVISSPIIQKRHIGAAFYVEVPKEELWTGGNTPGRPALLHGRADYWTQRYASEDHWWAQNFQFWVMFAFLGPYIIFGIWNHYNDVMFIDPEALDYITGKDE